MTLNNGHSDTNPSPEEALPLGHEYVGNLCGGFGGTTECEWFDLDTGRRCGKSPFEHKPMPVELERLLTPQEERRAPVNGSPYGTISWAEHLRAWEAYHRRHPQQDAERIAKRGGFGIVELIEQLGGMPTTWQPSELTRFMPGVEPYRRAGGDR